MAHTVAGLAVGDVGATGKAVTFTVVVTELVHPVVTVYVMTDEPANTPVTTPPVEIVATDSVPLLHVPPDVAFASVVVPFSQIVVEPVIDVVTDNGLTVSDLLTVTVPPQPMVVVYMMLQVQAALQLSHL